MKTLELKLKKDVLIVEIPRLADYEFINRECKYLKIGNEEIKLNASTFDKFEFLCKGSKLTEEIASELVEMEYSVLYKKSFFIDYDRPSLLLKFAKESFISAVESKEKFWLENPIKHPKNYEVFPDSLSLYAKQERLHLEAEEKTFRNPLIFVKK